MGLSALRKVLDPQPCRLSEIAGQTVAVDANNLLWTFVTGMARGGQPEGPHGRPISHIIGLVNRVSLYARHGIPSVWVFDGEQPSLKEATLAERQAKIQAAREAGDELAGTKLESFQIQEAKDLLDALGVPWIQAPAESDAQCAHWVRHEVVDAAVTQDYDAALHGCPVTYRNLKATGRRSPERMTLAPALDREGITREQLVDAAILIGTDYNDGIHGVGPVTALKLVRKHGDLRGALAARETQMPEAEAVRRLFLEHPVDKQATPTFTRPATDQVTELLAAHGLSKGRAQQVTAALGKLPVSH